MLLQALCAYYDLLAEAGEVTPPGYSKARIHYLVHLTQTGEIVGISNYQRTLEIGGGKGKQKLIPREEQLPERTEKPGIDANIVEHRPLYLFGLNQEGEKLTPEDKTGKAKKSHQELVESNLAFLEGLDSPVINAYRKFLENWRPEQETENPYLLGLGKDYAKSNYIFCVEGRPDLLLHHDPVLKAKWEKKRQEKDAEKEAVMAQCAITGQQEAVARIHGKIKGVAGGLATGSVLIGFNNSSECSYGREQSYNSNISETVMKKYTEALNYLLSSDGHKALVDDVTVVFWAMDSSGKSEMLFQDMLFGGSRDTLQAEQTELMLQNLLEETKKGSLTPKALAAMESIDPDTDFYMLGLKPNSSRLALKFIYHRKAADILYNVAKFQQDMLVSEASRAVHLYQIKRELVSPKSTDKKVNSAMMARLFEAILYNRECPQSLLSTIVKRIQTDASDENIYFNSVRAGVLKTCINRNHEKKEEQITMGLNKENDNQAYVCGRLFAVLEKLQQEASGDLNKTIKNTYFAAASVNPALVFPKLIRLAQNHLNKLNNPKFFNKQIAEVTDKLQDKFPDRLSLQEQGMFEIGYYQQYQSYFNKNITEKKEEQ